MNIESIGLKGKTNSYIYGMTTKLLLFVFLLTTPVIFAQEIKRVEVFGKIHVPAGDDAEGISVYNISSQKGVISKADGSFEIEVAPNDRLQIFALQYQTFTVVIDNGIIETKKLNVYVNPTITQLDEVIVRPYDLSGNIRADIAKIPAYTVDTEWDLSYKAMEFEYGFERDELSPIQGNVAEEALNSRFLQHGLNIVNIMGGVAQLLFPKGAKIDIARDQRQIAEVSNDMQQRFSREFIQDNFDIPKENAFDFLFYAQENGLENRLLKPENEIQLMDFLHKRSAEYKKRQEE